MILQDSVGLITLDSNQLIAGDVSANGKTNEYDAALILQFKVAAISSFPAGSWKFVPSQQQVDLGAGDTAEVSFTAILVGDVDGSWADYEEDN